MDKQDYTLENMRRLVLKDKDKLKFTKFTIQCFYMPYSFEYQLEKYVKISYNFRKVLLKIKQYFNELFI